RGPIPEPLRAGLGEWIFGCDVCQDVCPWNAKAAPSREPAWREATAVESPAALLALDADAFRARFRGTAIARAKRAGLLRNAALALGNGGGSGAEAALERALGDPEETVRDAAAWALEHLKSKASILMK
ncbi:MAG: epoxyqueuosine reductase, partial [Candidatus Rokubacteria bacterium]|nr:epoxyqueuosine reductase [Candidatus Rokubacteria bacterium]